MRILNAGSRTAYEVAARMTWNFDAASWERFPTMQKWFAMGESAAHLRYLEAKGKVGKTIREGTFVYAIS